jgi:hypothetical protein
MAIVSRLAEETNLFTPRQIGAKDKFLFKKKRGNKERLIGTHSKP